MESRSSFLPSSLFPGIIFKMLNFRRKKIGKQIKTLVSKIQELTCLFATCWMLFQARHI